MKTFSSILRRFFPLLCATTLCSNGFAQELRPVVAIRASHPEAPEPTPISLVAPGQFLLTRTGDATMELRVWLRYEGTAAPDDYEPLPASVVFPVGKKEITFDVLPKVDSIHESTETVVAHLLPPPTTPESIPYEIDPEHSRATMYILDSSAWIPRLVSIEATMRETSEPAPNILIAPGMFTVRRTGSTTDSLTVLLHVAGTATPNLDYVPLPQLVEIPAGSSAVEVKVLPLDDQQIEPTESVVAHVVVPPTVEADPVYAPDPAASSAEVLIHDTDRPSDARIEITHPQNGDSFPLGDAVRIEAVAVDPHSYLPRVEFYADETRIGVSEIVFVRAPDPGTPIHHSFVWNDPPEGEHRLTVRAIDSQGHVVISDPVTILVGEGDSRPVVSVHLAEYNTLGWPDADFARGSFEFSRTGSAEHALSVWFAVGGTATSGVDYEPIGTLVNFAEGEAVASVKVEAIDDEVPEPHETVAVTLMPVPPNVDVPLYGYYRIDPEHSTATVVILDNDRPAGDATLMINSPAPGAAFPLGEPILIEATAIDPNGYISTVDFYADGQLIGASVINFLVPPEPGTPIHHEFLWQNAPAGEHRLTAQAVLANGQVITSEGIAIIVGEGDDLPVVSVRFQPHLSLEPWPDADFAPGSFEFRRTGSLEEPLRIFFETGGTATSGVDYEPLGISILFAEGAASVHLRVEAIDDELPEGNETVVLTLLPSSPALDPAIHPPYRIDPEHSSARLIILDNDEPTSEASLVIHSPLPHTSLPAGSPIPITATAIDPHGYIDTVDFYADGELIGTSVINFVVAPDPGTPVQHEIVWQNAPAGEHHLTARAALADGQVITSASVRIFVGEGNHLPLVSVQFREHQTAEPWPDADFAPGSFEFRRTGSTEEPLMVFFQVRGTAIREVDYEWFPWHVVFEEGESVVHLRVEAIDDELPEGNETVVVTIIPMPPTVDPIYPAQYRIDPEHFRATVVILDNDAPAGATLTITSPPAGSIHPPGEPIVIQATAIDPNGYIPKVEFLADGQIIGTRILVFIWPPEPGTPIHYSFVWENAPPGEHVLTAQAVDSQGKEIVSPPVPILVQRNDQERVVLTIEAIDPVATEPLLRFNAPPTGDEDTATFRIKRIAGPEDIPVYFVYGIDGSAQNGLDYTELSGELVLPANAKYIELEIHPLIDNHPEGEETVFIALRPLPCVPPPNEDYLEGMEPVPPECYLVGHPGTARAVIRDADTGNHPPVVTIFRPHDGAVFRNGQPINVLVEASDRDGSIVKLELLADEEVLAVSETGRLEFTWNHAGLGRHALRARATDQAGAVGFSDPVRILVEDVDTRSFVHRELPGGYIAGQPFTVLLQANPPSEGHAYALQDQPPQGWTVSEISLEGAFDAATGQVKFGPFTDVQPRTLSYVVTPPDHASGPHEFSGVTSLDGRSYPIGGDRVITGGNTHHPADVNVNNDIVLDELTTYAAAWRTGSHEIPLSFLTRAGYIWKHGEIYSFDPAQGPPPLCWVPAVNSPELAALDLRQAQFERAISPPPSPGEPFTVSITIAPDSDVSAYALEEKIPTGWTVSRISHGGHFQNESGSIRWGVFMDAEPRLFTYTLVPPPDVVSIATISGQASFDGRVQNLTNRGRLAAFEDAVPVRIERCEKLSNGEVLLRLSGGAGQVCVIEASSNLVDWNEVTVVFLPDGTLDFSDLTGSTASRRFYRMRVH